MSKSEGLPNDTARPKKRSVKNRLTAEQKAVVAQRLREGAGLTNLAREFGVSRGAIYNVRIADCTPDDV